MRTRARSTRLLVVALVSASLVTITIGNFLSTLVRLPSIRRELEDAREQIAEFRAEFGEVRSGQMRLAELEAILGLQDSLSRRLETPPAEGVAHSGSHF